MLNRHPSSSDIRGIYHDIRLFSAEIATTDMARDGLVRAQSWPVVPSQPATLWPRSSRVKILTDKAGYVAVFRSYKMNDGSYSTCLYFIFPWLCAITFEECIQVRCYFFKMWNDCDPGIICMKIFPYDDVDFRFI